jgi:leucyl aminopeptidase
MPIVPTSDTTAIPLLILDPGDLSSWLAIQDAATRTWVASNGFEAGLGEVLALPGSEGGIARVLVGWGGEDARARGRFHLAAAAANLPAGRYAVEGAAADRITETEALGWLFGEYRFDRYKPGKARPRELVCPAACDGTRLGVIAEAARLAQDLINTPARWSTLSSTSPSATAPRRG